MTVLFPSFIKNNTEHHKIDLIIQDWINCISYLSEINTKPKSTDEWSQLFDYSDDETGKIDSYIQKQLGEVLRLYHNLNSAIDTNKIYEYWSAPLCLENLSQEIIQYVQDINSIYQSEVKSLIDRVQKNNISALLENEIKSLCINLNIRASSYYLHGKNIFENIRSLYSLISRLEEINLFTLNNLKEYIVNIKDDGIKKFVKSILSYLENDIEKMKKNITKEKKLLKNIIELWVFELDSLARISFKSSQLCFRFNEIDTQFELVLQLEEIFNSWIQMEKKISIFLVNWKNYLQNP